MKVDDPRNYSPLLPPFFAVLAWVVFRGWILSSSRAQENASFAWQNSLVFAVVAILGFFSVSLLISFLLKRKIPQFFISLLLLLGCSFLPALENKFLDPHKIRAWMDAPVVISRSSSRSIDYGGSGPRQICKEKPGAVDLLSCRVCFCQQGLQLREANGVHECLLRGPHWQSPIAQFQAPCSELRDTPKGLSEMHGLFANDRLKTYSIYSYRDKKLQACREYRVWADWDPSELKKVCEFGTGFQCVVKDRSNCSLAGSSFTCLRKNQNTHVSTKLVVYAKTADTSDFSPDECLSPLKARIKKEDQAGGAAGDPAPEGTSASAGQANTNSDRFSAGVLVPVRDKQGQIAGFKLAALAPAGFLAQSNLLKNDVLKKIDGTILDSSHALMKFFSGKAPGTFSNLEIERDGLPKTIQLQWK